MSTPIPTGQGATPKQVDQIAKHANNGGPAFPFEYHNQTRSHQPGFFGTGDLAPGASQQFAGMTLRDYFAAKSLPIAWAAYDKGYTGQPECVEQSIAHHAYQIADAMLRAREAT